MEAKLDKLDKLSRALQQERTELQTTIKNLSKPGTTTISSSNGNESSTAPEIPVNGHETSKTVTDESPNLYGQSLFSININYSPFVLISR